VGEQRGGARAVGPDADAWVETTPRMSQPSRNRQGTVAKHTYQRERQYVE
jgi:hypothetical protein